MVVSHKIEKNSTICGHCKHARSEDGNWQCNNPYSSAYEQQVSYAAFACAEYEPLGNRSKKPDIPRELLEKIQAFIEAEWISPVASEYDSFDAPIKSSAPVFFPLKDVGYSRSEECSRTVEEPNAMLDLEVIDSLPNKGVTAGRHRASEPLVKKGKRNLDDIIGPLGQTFQEKLLVTIDAKGLKDSEVYSRANIDRRLFSKIRSNKNYKPSKPTALAFAIALGLNLDETTDLLQRAGLALSPSSKADLIVKYCILNGIYDIYDVNAILYEYDQQLLGY